MGNQQSTIHQGQIQQGETIKEGETPKQEVPPQKSIFGEYTKYFRPNESKSAQPRKTEGIGKSRFIEENKDTLYFPLSNTYAVNGEPKREEEHVKPLSYKTNEITVAKGGNIQSSTLRSSQTVEIGRAHV